MSERMYSKEELIKAMVLWNKDYLNDPESATEINDTVEYATEQVEYLISKII